MPGPHSSESNGLLALLYAAQCMESSADEKKCKSSAWETSKSYSRTSHYSESKLSKEKKSLGSRCSHNELEKRRRGYLKYCMEQLKEKLDFKTETARITTLSVLKKAKNEILHTSDEIAKFDELIKKERVRAQLLSKRKFQIKKKLEERNNLRRALSWRERNRNYSECSVATTSSEESELDYYATRQTIVPSGRPKQMVALRSLTPQQTRTTSMLPPRKHLTSISEHHVTGGVAKTAAATATHLSMLRPATVGEKPAATSANSSTTDLFMDGSSSDSGYEEISSLTPPGTSECLSPMDVSASKCSLPVAMSSIAKANQMIHRDAAIAVLQGTVIPRSTAASYWNSVSSNGHF